MSRNSETIKIEKMTILLKNMKDCKEALKARIKAQLQIIARLNKDCYKLISFRKNKEMITAISMLFSKQRRRILNKPLQISKILRNQTKDKGRSSTMQMPMTSKNTKQQ